VFLRITEAGRQAVGLGHAGTAEAGTAGPCALPVADVGTVPKDLPLPEDTQASPATQDRDGQAAGTDPHRQAQAGALRLSLRHAAQTVLAAWDEAATLPAALAEAMSERRAALSKQGRATAAPPRAPRSGTKQEQVLTYCGAARVPAPRRSPQPWAGRHTRCAASWPDSAKWASQSRAGAGPAGRPKQAGREGLLHGLPDHGLTTGARLLNNSALWALVSHIAAVRPACPAR
jgi:hypothetical protein